MLDLSLEQILRILAARYRMVLVVTVVAIAGTYVGCLLWPAQYTATATVVVDNKTPDPSASATASTTSSSATQNSVLSIGTEADIIVSERVVRRAVSILHLEDNQVLQRRWRDDTDGLGSLNYWIADLILKKLTAKSSTTSNVIPIKYIGADPDFAALVANAVAQAYIETNIALKVEPAKQYSEWFAQQEKALRESLENSQAAMYKFQSEKGIVANSEQQDQETSALSDLEKQLFTAIGVSSELRSKKQAGADVNSLPEVVNNSLLNTIKGEISRHESKLQEAAGNLGRNHPQYQRMEKELESFRENLRVETANVIKSISASLEANDRKVEHLRSAYEAQKKKVLFIKADRDRLAVLQTEVENAKKALEAIGSRYRQVDVFSQGNQAQIAILTPAVAPREPSAPKTLVYTLLSIPMGLLLGVLAALSMEQYDRRIRSAEDVALMLPSPLLGTIARRRAPHRFSPQKWIAFWRRRRAVAAT